jgi:hypothetical protein
MLFRPPYTWGVPSSSPGRLHASVPEHYEYEIRELLGFVDEPLDLSLASEATIGRLSNIFLAYGFYMLEHEHDAERALTLLRRAIQIRHSGDIPRGDNFEAISRYGLCLIDRQLDISPPEELIEECETVLALLLKRFDRHNAVVVKTKYILASTACSVDDVENVHRYWSMLNDVILSENIDLESRARCHLVLAESKLAAGRTGLGAIKRLLYDGKKCLDGSGHASVDLLVQLREKIGMVELMSHGGASNAVTMFEANMAHFEHTLAFGNAAKRMSAKKSLVSTYGHMARAKLCLEDYEEAVKFSTKVIASDDDTQLVGQAYHVRARAYVGMEQYGFAEPDFSKALDTLVSMTAIICVDIANMFLKTRDFSQALFYFKGARSVAREKHQPAIISKASYEIAKIYARSSTFDLARKCLQESLEAGIDAFGEHSVFIAKVKYNLARVERDDPDGNRELAIKLTRAVLETFEHRQKLTGEFLVEETPTEPLAEEIPAEFLVEEILAEPLAEEIPAEFPVGDSVSDKRRGGPLPVPETDSSTSHEEVALVEESRGSVSPHTGLPEKSPFGIPVEEEVVFGVLLGPGEAPEGHLDGVVEEHLDGVVEEHLDDESAGEDQSEILDKLGNETSPLLDSLGGAPVFGVEEDLDDAETPEGEPAEELGGTPISAEGGDIKTSTGDMGLPFVKLRMGMVVRVLPDVKILETLFDGHLSPEKRELAGKVGVITGIHPHNSTVSVEFNTGLTRETRWFCGGSLLQACYSDLEEAYRPRPADEPSTVARSRIRTYHHTLPFGSMMPGTYVRVINDKSKIRKLFSRFPEQVVEISCSKAGKRGCIIDTEIHGKTVTVSMRDGSFSIFKEGMLIQDFNPSSGPSRSSAASTVDLASPSRRFEIAVDPVSAKSFTKRERDRGDTSKSSVAVVSEHDDVVAEWERIKSRGPSLSASHTPMPLEPCPSDVDDWASDLYHPETTETASTDTLSTISI